MVGWEYFGRRWVPKRGFGGVLIIRDEAVGFWVGIILVIENGWGIEIFGVFIGLAVWII